MTTLSPPTGLVAPRLGENVLFDEDGSCGFLLDFRRDRFFGLNATAAKLLSQVLAHGPRDGIAAISREYGVDEAAVRRDWTVLEKRLLAAKLLAQRESDCRTSGRILRGAASVAAVPFRLFGRWLFRRPTGQVRRSPGRLTVWFTLTFVWFSLRIIGWSRTMAFVRWATQSRRNVPSCDLPEAVDVLNDHIRRSTKRQSLLSITCKERAMAGYWLLRSRFGLQPTVVVGIERYPFRAHAWIECRRRILTDDPEFCDTYTPVARFV